MPRLTFITPAALVLLALLPLLWAFALWTPRRVAPRRFWLGLALRSVMLAALILGLAGAQLVQPVSTLTTIFLIDESDSVAPAQRERAVSYIDQALRTMPPSDKAAVVVFGANPLVERAPGSLVTARGPRCERLTERFVDAAGHRLPRPAQRRPEQAERRDDRGSRLAPPERR